jgi:hypothetical protein
MDSIGQRKRWPCPWELDSRLNAAKLVGGAERAATSGHSLTFSLCGKNFRRALKAIAELRTCSDPTLVSTIAQVAAPDEQRDSRLRVSEACLSESPHPDAKLMLCDCRVATGKLCEFASLCQKFQTLLSHMAKGQVTGKIANPKDGLIVALVE